MERDLNINVPAHEKVDFEQRTLVSNLNQHVDINFILLPNDYLLLTAENKINQSCSTLKSFYLRFTFEVSTFQMNSNILVEGMGNKGHVNFDGLFIRMSWGIQIQPWGYEIMKIPTSFEEINVRFF